MDWMWICSLLLAVPLAFGLQAHLRVIAGSRLLSKKHLASANTGVQVAQQVLRNSGLRHVQVVSSSGFLADYYDIREEVVSLDPQTAQNSNLVAVGIAAHEAGHAIQDARSNMMMRFRQLGVPSARIVADIWPIGILLGLALSSTWVFLIGLVLYVLLVLFQLATIQSEFEASRLAFKVLYRRQAFSEEKSIKAAESIHLAAVASVALLLPWSAFMRIRAYNTR